VIPLVVLCLVAAITSAAQAYVWATDVPATVPAGLTFVTTGTHQSRFEAWGPRTGRPVVLVHGAFESVAIWRPVAAQLSGSVRVEAFDLEGYGYSDHVGPYTTGSLAAQLQQFLLARHLEHPILVGHSLGAGVIARFVLDHPGVASGIAFVDGDGLSATYPGSWVPGFLPDPYRTALYRSVVRSSSLVSTIFGLACGPGCPTLAPGALEEVQRPFLVAGAEQALLALSSRPIVGVTAPELSRLRAMGPPALVVFGAQDDVYPTRTPAQTAARIGAPDPVLIARCGHLSLWSHPSQVAGAIRSLLDRVELPDRVTGSDGVQTVQGSGASVSMP